MKIPVTMCWISVEDALPEEGTEVLIYSEEVNNPANVDIATRESAIFRSTRLEEYDTCRESYCQVTYWMQLPPKPQE